MKVSNNIDNESRDTTSSTISDFKKFMDEVHRMNDKCVNGFGTPFEADSNEDYECKLRNRLDEFVKEIDKPAIKREGILPQDIKIICEKVISAFEAAKTGNLKESENVLAEILEDYKKIPFAVSELDKNYAFRGIAPFGELRQKWAPEEQYDTMLEGDLNFFRARIVKEDQESQERKDINYLPYSKQDLAQDMRFSSRGKICLYLGTTSYVCSRECRWDKKGKLYLASFKFNEKGKKLKILNLVVTERLLNGLSALMETKKQMGELWKTLIRVFPLMIATAFTIRTSEEREHKYEYLLSQVLINVLQKVGIDGVAYLSRQGKNDLQYPQMVCLAIPVTDVDPENEYGSLIRNFSMTCPVLYDESFNDYKTDGKKSYINEKYPKDPEYPEFESCKRDNTTAQIEYDGKTVFYEDTVFSKLDNYLVNQVHEEIE